MGTYNWHISFKSGKYLLQPLITTYNLQLSFITENWHLQVITDNGQVQQLGIAP